MRGGAAVGPDAIVSLGLGDLEALASGSASPPAIRARADVQGKADAAGELLAALAPA